MLNPTPELREALKKFNTKFTFVRIKRKDFDFGVDSEKHWYLLITNTLELMEYLPHRIKYFVEIYKKAKERTIVNPKNPHFSAMEFVIAIHCEKDRMERAVQNPSLISDLEAVGDLAAQSLNRLVFDGRGALVNEVGGMMPATPEYYEILETVESNAFKFPRHTNTESEGELKIIQWINGTHFYAKIGQEDVVWNGEQKWGTEKDAREAARNYLASCLNSAAQEGKEGWLFDMEIQKPYVVIAGISVALILWIVVVYKILESL